MNHNVMYINCLLSFVILSLILGINFIPSPYCDDEIKSDCRKCPKGAYCSGLTVSCPSGTISNGAECVRSSESQSLFDSLKEKCEIILRKQMGGFQCNNYTSKVISHAFVTRKELERELSISPSSAVYPVFLEVLKTLPCYSFNDPLLHSKEPIRDTNLAILTECTSTSENPYFILSDDPILSYECRLNKFIQDHRSDLDFYIYRLMGSFLITMLMTIMITSGFECFEILTEVNNILIENQSSPVEVSVIEKRILRTGSHPILAHIVWLFIPMIIRKRKDILVLKRESGEVDWKWTGDQKIIRKCSRRPNIKKNVDVSDSSEMREFVSEVY